MRIISLGRNITREILIEMITLGTALKEEQIIKIINGPEQPQLFHNAYIGWVKMFALHHRAKTRSTITTEIDKTKKEYLRLN